MHFILQKIRKTSIRIINKLSIFRRVVEYWETPRVNKAE